eukprot:429779-Ditylum_brightwellii.AAC.1
MLEYGRLMSAVYLLLSAFSVSSGLGASTKNVWRFAMFVFWLAWHCAANVGAMCPFAAGSVPDHTAFAYPVGGCIADGAVPSVVVMMLVAP